MADRRHRPARVAMPERPPRERSADFGEVNLGYDLAQAVTEASRCIACRRPPCVDGCPVGLDIPAVVGLLRLGDLEGAAAVVGMDNALPAVCGRVCPQEHQCEGACVLGRKHQPVAIGAIERFVGDWALAHEAPRPTVEPSGRRVAVVGSGPAGLACAGDLARSGHAVTVFEALHTPGGVLVYGIPEFRLPKRIVSDEIERLASLGVDIVTDAVIGAAESVEDLLDTFDAVFLGLGAGLPRFLGIAGEDLVGVYSANEFLTRVNLMGAWRPDATTPVLDLEGVRVGVFGGGNTAMDAVRTALRLGAAEATILYRRSEAEMPARIEEVLHARDEGVRVETLVAPVAFVGAGGHLSGAVLQDMELGEPDASGRRRPEPVAGSEHQVPLDVAVVAIGNGPNPLVRRASPGIPHSGRGTIVAEPDTGRTPIPGLFAGGDIVTGGATVILAMGAGRRAAASIDQWLVDGVWEPARPTVPA